MTTLDQLEAAYKVEVAAGEAPAPAPSSAATGGVTS